MSAPATSWLTGMRHGIDPDLSRIRAIVAALGHPELAYPTAHVGGTNGKGSTCAMLAAALRADGRKVGLMTSPHLIRLHERLQVDNRCISDITLAGLAGEVRAAADATGCDPTFFEFITALGFLYFARQRVDIAVIEVGMGGTWDATTMVRPAVSVVTNVGLEHQEYLGEDLASIAAEKAGIIKQGVPVVTTASGEGLSALARRAGERDAPLHVVRYTDAGEKALRMQDEDARYAIGLRGAHQLANAACAISAARLLGVSDDALRQGLLAAHIDGRLERLSIGGMDLLLDGAHNADGFAALLAALDALGPEEKIAVLVCGLKKGKDASLLSDIARRAAHVVCTQAAFLPAPCGALAAALGGEAIPSVRAALSRAGTLAGHAPGRGLVLVTGSLYLVGDALSALTGQKKELDVQY